jgi:hypothetical protein
VIGSGDGPAERFGMAQPESGRVWLSIGQSPLPITIPFTGAWNIRLGRRWLTPTSHKLPITNPSDPTVPPLTAIKLGNRFQKILTLEVRPKRLSDIHFGVAQLPK